MQQKATQSFCQAQYDQVQAECFRRVPVPDPLTGRWKRPRPEQAEGPTQYVKNSSEEEDHHSQTPKKRAASATTISVETDPSHGNFHESASCLQKHDVSRKTDQSMIEAARCITNCWER